MKAAIKHMLSAFLCLILFNAYATEEQAIEKITINPDCAPSSEDGKATVGACARCHLPEAWGNADGTYPQIAGQHVNGLMKQLLDIRSGARQSPEWG